MPVIVETSVLKRNDRLLNNSTTTSYNSKGGPCICSGKTYDTGKNSTTETFYKYDLYGKLDFRPLPTKKSSGEIRLYQEREITYTDGIASGNVDFYRKPILKKHQIPRISQPICL